MAKPFFLSFQYRVGLFLFVFLNIAFLLIGFFGQSLLKDALVVERGNHLLSITRILDSFIPDGGYDQILREEGLENASRKEKIAGLNARLSKVSNMVGESSEGLGVGYYSNELDAILTYGPSSSFKHMVGVSIAPDHPGREVMSSNQPSALYGSMVRGNILNGMLPLERQGKLIGYIWANQLKIVVVTEVDSIVTKFGIIMILCFVFATILLGLLTLRVLRDAATLINGVEAMRSDLSFRIPKLAGKLGDVAHSINAMTQDISDANDESSRAIAVLQSIMNKIDAGIYIYDIEQKRIVYVNKYSHEVFGLNDLDGETFYEIFHAASEVSDYSLDRIFFSDKGKPNFQVHHREEYIPKIGKDLFITERLVTWHDGRLLHMLVATDMTERKALLAAELVNQAQREFLARVSHEIRTPMNGVIGMTHLAMQAEPPLVNGYLKKIQSSGELLLSIINDILDLSSMEVGKMSIEKSVINLQEIVENVHDLILPRLSQKNVELIIDIDDSVPKYAIGDSLRLTQILINLLGNASKFTLQGTVTLRIKGQKTQEGLLRLYCDIQDTGIGITPEQQKELFKPFSQADVSTARRFGGTGLGLSICKALVEIMGGQISVSSKDAVGSTFSFYIDFGYCAPGQEIVSDEEAPWQHAKYEGHTFLLVEDNAINQEIAMAILNGLGIEVDIADDGQQGLEAFLKKDYSLILMDIRMPIMNGFEATKAIRESTKHDGLTVPIVAMTADAMEEDKRDSKNAGMNEHITKPIDLNQLKKVFYNILVLHEINT